MSTLTVKLPSKQYNIYIEKGLIKNLGLYIKKLYNGEKIIIVTDENVNKFYGKIIEEILIKEGYNVKLVVVSAGEESKSLEVLESVYDKLLDFKITRGDLIIALGGGVVGDLTGFAASTLLRGIPFIQIPTSLLAQIDSSIGGKVAVNLSRGKNLIGSFYHPEAVFIDPEVLNTLDTRFIHDGMAEVIKYGCIKDKNLFSKLESYNNEEFFENIEEIIYTCCSIKKEIVEQDEKDTGLRMLLNFGHTLGHAIEKYFNYEKYSHGEAVAMGMYSITKKSESLGLTKQCTSQKLKFVLNKYGLNEKAPDMNLEAILNTVTLDKKSNRDSINLIILKDLGEAYIEKVKKVNASKFFIQ